MKRKQKVRFWIKLIASAITLFLIGDAIHYYMTDFKGAGKEIEFLDKYLITAFFVLFTLMIDPLIDLAVHIYKYVKYKDI